MTLETLQNILNPINRAQIGVSADTGIEDLAQLSRK
jgi:hypothetical protein